MELMKISSVVPTGLILGILKRPSLVRLLQQRPTLWLLDRLKMEPEPTIHCIVREIADSDSRRYAAELVSILTVLPDSVLERNDVLRTGE
jgi:hypothetical protein